MTIHERLSLSGLALGAVMNAGTPTVAQELPTGVAGWEIRVTNTVTPSRPTTTVEVWAVHLPNGGPQTTFASGDFDLIASDGRFSDQRWIWGWGSPICHFGEIRDHSVEGVFWLQPGHPFTPLVANPFAVWAATWTTEDFTPRRVSLGTANTNDFHLHYLYRTVWYSYNIVPYRAERFFPGHAEIEVTADRCYADCDSSTGLNVLDIFDFLCFQNLYAAADPIACDCDTTTGGGVCDIFDFLCFQGRFVAGCP